MLGKGVTDILWIFGTIAPKNRRALCTQKVPMIFGIIWKIIFQIWCQLFYKNYILFSKVRKM